MTPWSRSARNVAVRLDRVVDARPCVPAHLRALAHLEDRRLVRVTRDRPSATRSPRRARTPDSASSAARARSRPTPRAARSPRPGARRPGRRRTPPPRAAPTSVESAGRLPTSSSSLSTLGATLSLLVPSRQPGCRKALPLAEPPQRLTNGRKKTTAGQDGSGGAARCRPGRVRLLRLRLDGRRPVGVEALDRLDAPRLALARARPRSTRRGSIRVEDEVAAGRDLDRGCRRARRRRGRSPARSRAWTARPRWARRCRGRGRRRAGTPRACRPRRRGGAGGRARRRVRACRSARAPSIERLIQAPVSVPSSSSMRS